MADEPRKEKPGTEVAGAELESGSGERHQKKSNAASASNDIDQPVALSKTQLKKKRKFEKKMEIKKRRKLQEKETRRARAKAQGRDIEQEQREMEARRLNGEGRKRRQAEWHARAELASKSFQVCLDCSFSEKMTQKEIGSLSLQIRYCYSENKKCHSPCRLSATSLEGETLKHLKNVSGFDGWKERGFVCTTSSLEEQFRDSLSNVVYLTSDSDNTLEKLDATKIYVIGGIVDRNRLKRAAISRAQTIGVATAKLPLERYLKDMPSTRVLTCNHVFSILLKCSEYNNDWKKALKVVLPSRKDAKVTD